MKLAPLLLLAASLQAQTVKPATPPPIQTELVRIDPLLSLADTSKSTSAPLCCEGWEGALQLALTGCLIIWFIVSGTGTILSAIDQAKRDIIAKIEERGK